MNLPADPSAKRDVRDRILAARAAISAKGKVAADEALARHAGALPVRDRTVCAYVPTRREPGSTSLLAALTAAGARVLLPVAREAGPMNWAEFTGDEQLVSAPFGLREPSGPALPPEVVATATWLLVPALAVDRDGVRLGRGAGFYDRTLGLAAPDARIVAVVFDHELVTQLPSEPHDKKVGWALTPGYGLVQLGRE
ncbi:5-formyltetrahydrofolate cyclo-ligase [Aldersonia kunmingensis]|uniref:5-formyltetrahydrofolate cyclo-ligase n=1 Tax=Aldersonia kunmingensis TaxID=408066 RepID=UPI000B108E2B|nr:5-formyltetrahydrofolate cyclo-ligase [Aldersonia kunmingensis]